MATAVHVGTVTLPVLELPITGMAAVFVAAVTVYCVRLPLCAGRRQIYRRSD